MAFEAARQLIRTGFSVAGVVLIDSPTPMNHVPLSEALLDAVIKSESSTSRGDLAPYVKSQFTANSRMLGHYDPRATKGPFPALTYLRSTEGVNLKSVQDIPSWLAERNDLNKLVEGWETLTGTRVKTFDIPGNHFQVFKSENVSIFFFLTHSGCVIYTVF